MPENISYRNISHIYYCCRGRKDVAQNLLAWQKSRAISSDETLRAFSDIYIYGKKIIDSEVFDFSFEQIHHYYLSVGEHTLHVALYALGVAYRIQKNGKKINLRDIVISSLCHDLGIIKRHEKFENNIVCCYLHPVHSLKIAKKLIPDLSADAEKAILRHMFPLLPLPPLSRTGIILVNADKVCSVSELKTACDFKSADRLSISTNLHSLFSRFFYH